MTSSKIKGQEMAQIIETLPVEGKERLKNTYENIIDLGIEKGIDLGIQKGIQKGLERGEDIKQLKLTFNAVESGPDIAFTTSFLGVSEKLIKLIKVNLADDFKSKKLATVLATQLFDEFEHLEVEDIAKYCKLPVENIQTLKEKLDSI